MLAAVTILLWVVLPVRLPARPPCPYSLTSLLCTHRHPSQQLFWGSTWLLEHYFYRINIDVVDFDSSTSGSSSNALLGPVITQGLMKARWQDSVTLGWDVRDPKLYPNGLVDVQNRILTDGAWGAVVSEYHYINIFKLISTNGLLSSNSKCECHVCLARGSPYWKQLVRSYGKHRRLRIERKVLPDHPRV